MTGDKNAWTLGVALWSAVQRERERIGLAFLNGQLSTDDALHQLDMLREQYHHRRDVAARHSQEILRAADCEERNG